MSELLVTCDESGNFGRCNPRSLYYIATFLLHDQASTDKTNELTGKLDAALAPFQLRNAVHTGPLIRREEEYKELDVTLRRQIFQRMFTFARASKTTYHSFIADKRHVTGSKALADIISKQIRGFIFEHLAFFQGYDRVVLHYDFGQAELTKILVNAFTDVLNSVEVRKVLPADSRLFQATDLLCTLELLALKAEDKALSRSELNFFRSENDLIRTYIKPIQKKRI